MSLNLDPQTLLSAMTAGSGRAALLQQALQNADLDPVMGQLVGQMLARSETAEAEAEAQDELAARDERIDELRQTLKDTSDTLARMQAELERLRAERRSSQEDLAAAVEQVELLAGALGICSECIGETDDCPTCGGRGYAGSGFIRPDPVLYRRFVSPVAVRRPFAPAQGPVA
jgi:DNA repair exonuclease SbcCD ATPase subunit